MIEFQCLNYIVQNKDASFLIQYDEEFYPKCKTEYNFLREHFRQYRVLPDEATIKDRCPSFPFCGKVTEPKAYLETRLYNDLLQSRLANALSGENAQKLGASIVANPQKGLADLQSIIDSMPKPPRRIGTNIITDSPTRLEALKEKLANPESAFLSTGLDELDMIMGGLRCDEDFVIIFARTNNGKSWLAEKIAVEVWGKGNNVGFFSPEMSKDQTGYRFDTLFKNWSNKDIQGVYGENTLDLELYEKYITKLSKCKTIFSVADELDFDDNKPTISDMKRWIEQDNLKLLVIDGISYLSDESGGRSSEREQLANVCKALKSLSKEMHIPIIGVHQANRVGNRDKDGEVSKKTPEVDTLFGADAIGHIATRVLSVSKDGQTFNIYKPKDRFCEMGQRLIYNFETNIGKWTYVDNPKSGLALPPEAPSVRDEYTDEEEAF